MTALGGIDDHALEETARARRGVLVRNEARAQASAAEKSVDLETLVRALVKAKKAGLQAGELGGVHARLPAGRARVANPRRCGEAGLPGDRKRLACSNPVYVPLIPTAIDACLASNEEGGCEEVTRALGTLRDLGLDADRLANAESQLLASRREQLGSLVEAAQALTVFTAPGAMAQVAVQIAALVAGIESHGGVLGFTATLLAADDPTILAARAELQRLEQAAAEAAATHAHLDRLVDSEEEGSEMMAEISEAVTAAALVLPSDDDSLRKARARLRALQEATRLDEQRQQFEQVQLAHHLSVCS